MGIDQPRLSKVDYAPQFFLATRLEMHRTQRDRVVVSVQSDRDAPIVNPGNLALRGHGIAFAKGVLVRLRNFGSASKCRSKFSCTRWAR